jgi:hypothetical protein
MKEVLFTASIPKEAHCSRISSAMIHRHGGVMRCWSCRRVLDVGMIIYSPSHSKGVKVRCLPCSIMMGVLTLEMPDGFNICTCGHSARSIETFRRHVRSMHHSSKYSRWLVDKGVGKLPRSAVSIGFDGTVERIGESEN